MSGVAIIIPTYNRSALVGRAIESVVVQTYSILQLIVVDDGSTDDTQAVLSRYVGDSRIRVHRHHRNLGVTAAKNSGLELVPPDVTYVGILDSDDVLLPDAVGTMVEAFSTTGGPWSQVLGWHIDRGSRSRRGRMTRSSGPVTYEDALHGRFSGDFWHLARRDLIDGLRFEARASGGEGALWWRLLRIAPAWLVPDVVGIVDSTGGDRVSRWDGSTQAAAGRMWAYQATLDAVGNDLRVVNGRRFGEMSAELAKWAAVAGDGRRARSAVGHTLRYAPSVRAILLAALACAPRPVVLLAARFAARRRPIRA